MTTRKPRGLFLNPTKANCSIYESGRMMYECLRHSDDFDLDYRELEKSNPVLPGGYDFYAFNYHHITLSWLDTKQIRNLPGLKLTFVLEVAQGNPFALCPRDDFDAYLALDPSLVHPDPRVFAFPRPLELPPTLEPFVEPDIPVIGSFGFATPGKGFELVADAVSREFVRAKLRINIPPGTYADETTHTFFRRPYAEYLEELVRRSAAPGIDVEVTQHYFDEKDLITWCGQNSLNCFLYNRDQPGLSATTDQAIASARPLAVSTNPTFRHIHPYLKPYPYRSLKEALATSLPEVLQMRQDWSPASFAKRFAEVLASFKLLPPPAVPVLLRKDEPQPKVPVLIVNHDARQCGIHQYGLDIFSALQKSKRYAFTYAECEDATELRGWVAKTRPEVILFNHYPFTMPWVTPDLTRSLDQPQVGIMHECTQDSADAADQSLFDYHLCPDPTLVERNPFVFRIPRLIPTYVNFTPIPAIPRIGTFGFGFGDKGFPRVIERVQEEFDEAEVFLHMPKNDLVEGHVEEILETCRKVLYKPGIKVTVSHAFLDMPTLMATLGGCSMNVFLYDLHKDKGISSVVEKAIGAGRPVAVNRAGMFRHVHGARPSICVEDRPLKEILAGGLAPLVPFMNEWNEGAFIKALEETFDKILARGPSPRPKAGAETVQAGPRRILWVRPDAIGDTIMALSMLPEVAARYPGAMLVAVCQEVVAPLYGACPHVQEVIAFDRDKAFRDPAYLEDLCKRVRQVEADLCLHSVHSREALGDVLVAASGAAERVGFGGDLTNMTEDEHRKGDPLYTTLLPAQNPTVREVDRHLAFVRALGSEAEGLTVKVWLRPEDELAADYLFNAKALPKNAALAVFPGSKAGLRVYPRLAEALAPLVSKERPLLLFGNEAERAQADAILEATGGFGLNLCGNLPLRVTAALLKRCKLAVGVENGLIQLACAVGLPQVVALGGTFFGRFLPHSPLTSAAVLPLDCYLCNGKCEFERPYCIQDLEPSVYRRAILAVLEAPGTLPRFFQQEGWKRPAGGPQWFDLAAAVDPALSEVIRVKAGRLVTATSGEADPGVLEARTTVICAVWHKDPNRLERLQAHQACLDAQTVPVDRVYVFDGDDRPPSWLKGRVVVNREPLLIYEAWNMGLCRVRTPFVMNLNLDDRLCPQGVEILERALEGGADLVGGDWRICFNQEDTDAVGPIAEAGSVPFSPEWPPAQGTSIRLGSGTGDRGTFGPACLWRMALHAQFARYPWKFGDGTPIRIIGDAAWWDLLLKNGKDLRRLPVIIGHYHSHPGDQAEFRNPGSDEEARLGRHGVQLI